MYACMLCIVCSESTTETGHDRGVHITSGCFSIWNESAVFVLFKLHDDDDDDYDDDGDDDDNNKVDPHAFLSCNGPVYINRYMCYSL